MHTTRSFRFHLVACLLLVLAASLSAGCSARQNHWQDTDQRVLLAEKLKHSKYAYLRYAEAEEEAKRDGNPQAAERYRQAKEEALTNYNRTEQELASYQAAQGTAKPAK
ncbi:hypothetical protein [Solidesulfovibrio sp. C21]|uniref:hypothetical protein n=1 Tax=Solidesulfovibrio sp. C21 TaxID=3398613 RepID=UPI0039FDA142